MGRSLSKAIIDQPRRKVVRFTVSNPAYPVPAWATVAYVTGCAPGGGGFNSSSTGARGSGGGAGAFCSRVPLALSGAATIGVSIGGKGVGSAISSTAGTDAGGTRITVGALVLTLEGGKGATSDTNWGRGGRAYFGGSIANISNGDTLKPFSATGQAGYTAPPFPLGTGADGGQGNLATDGYGAGGFSAFGGGGPGVPAPAGPVAGGNADGFGGGGAGSAGGLKAGDGSPSFVDIEFLEVL